MANLGVPPPAHFVVQAKHAPGTKTASEIDEVAERAARHDQTWLDLQKICYGECFDDFVAGLASDEDEFGGFGSEIKGVEKNPAVAEYTAQLKAFYNKHAPGEKTEAELIPVAEHCAAEGTDWLNEPMKAKYGQSFADFLAWPEDEDFGGFGDTSVAAGGQEADPNPDADGGYRDTLQVEQSEEEAATVIQTSYRGHRARAKVEGIRVNKAATTIQSSYRGHKTREAVAQKRLAKAASVDSAEVERYTALLASYYAVHAPGKKTDADLKPIAERCASTGHEFMNGPLKRLYGQSLNEFKSKAEAGPEPEADTNEEFGGFGNETVGADEEPAVASETGILVQLKGYYSKHSPGTKTDLEIQAIASRVSQTGTARLNTPLKKKYGESFDEYVAGSKGSVETSGSQTSVERHMTDLKAYYDRHAPGTKSDADLLPVARHCVNRGTAWLDSPLQKKYGVTYSEFHKVTATEFKPSTRPMRRKGSAVYAIESGSDTYLEQLKGYYQRNAPGTKSTADLKPIADHCVAKGGTSWLDKALTAKYGQSFSQFMAAQATQPAGERATFAEPASGDNADGATVGSLSPDVAKFFTMIEGFYSKHANGKKTFADIKPMAEHCVGDGNGSDWLNTPLKAKYGESMTEFLATAASSDQPLYGNDEAIRQATDTAAANQQHAGTLAKITAIKVSHPNNLAMKHFSIDYFNSLATDEEKSGLLQCVNSGVENADSGMGCYAMQPKDYDRFKPFFSKVLAEYHKVAEDAKHDNDWSLAGVDGLPAGGRLDLTALGLPELSMRVRTGRNLKEFPLPGAMTKEDRINLETKMCTAFEKLKAMPEFGGGYNSLTPGHADHIDEDEYSQLIVEHIMFKDMAADTYLAAAGIASDWPYGRGCYVSEDRGFVIWVGEEDHLRIMCMKKAAVLNDVFDRLKAAIDVVNAIEGLEFAHSDDYGVVTSCPTNLGTGMRASVHIPIPNLTADGTDTKAKAICKPLGLSVRGTGGEHTPIGKDGTCDISPSARFCITEAEIITALYNGLKLLKEEEAKAGMSETQILGHLEGYYAKHAPGAKTDAELQSVAGRVFRGGSVRLNTPMKKKYGESFDEFVAGADARGAAAAAGDEDEDIYGEATFADAGDAAPSTEAATTAVGGDDQPLYGNDEAIAQVEAAPSAAGGASAVASQATASAASTAGVSEAMLLEQLAAYYSKHAPGTKSEEQLRQIAVRVMQSGTERLNAPMVKKYGQSFDEFVAVDAYSKKLMAFYAVHAPGTKSDQDIQPIAQRCAKTDATWLDTPLVKKYGQSFSDFVVDLEKNRVKVLQQLVAFYAKHTKVNVGDKVDVLNKGTGTARFIGAHHISGESRIGVELDSPNGKNNGTVKGHVYFTCKDMHGELCKPKKVAVLSTKSESDLAPIADRCSRDGSAWLDDDLKTKYGQSFTEFVASQ